LTNVKLYILDLHGHPQPVGVTGELCIGGAGLARGYLNRTELTAEKFNRSFNFNRSYKSYRTYILYKTGDLARWLPDGNIEFLGRIDHQVKVRGFRIELGEIESRLVEYEGLKEAVVTAQEDRTGDKHLLAYIVPSAGKVGEGQLREYLSAKLPDYMVPSYFIHLDELPLTTSGKIDRKSLPQPSEETFAGKVQYAAPRTDAEVKLVAIWSDILGLRRETIGIDDNFFERGGAFLKGHGNGGTAP
jgi:acyl-coenzyme A synthetase/AMP-(fatty) acid ligase